MAARIRKGDTVVVITGGARGIGGAIARALHKQGATVTLSGTRAEALEKLKAELGDRTHVITAKMDDPADIDRLAKEAEAAMGKIDILVNNAGITRDNLSMRMKDEDWEKVLQVNLTSVMVTMQDATPHMKAQRGGRMIVNSSVGGLRVEPHIVSGAYGSHTHSGLVGGSIARTMSRRIGSASHRPSQRGHARASPASTSAR